MHIWGMNCSTTRSAFAFSSWLNPKYSKHMEQFSTKYVIIKQICLCHLEHYFMWQGKWNLMFRFYFIWSSAVLAEDLKKKKRQMAPLKYELICAYSNMNLNILDKGMAQTSNWNFEAKKPKYIYLGKNLNNLCNCKNKFNIMQVFTSKCMHIITFIINKAAIKFWL